MATITGLRGKYDKLKNQERLRLVADAIIRDDGVDISALTETAPRYSYTVIDPWYVDRYNALWRISVMYWLTMEMLYSEQQVVEHKYTLARLLNDGVIKPEYVGKILGQIDAPHFLKLTEQKLENNARQLQATAAAIDLLAKEVGLEPDELIAHVPADIKEWAKKVVGGTPKEESQIEYVKHYYKIFAGYWPDLKVVKDDRV